MRLFKNKYSITPQQLFFYYLAAIIVPNFVLCFTEGMPWLADICNIVLPASVYAFLLTLKKRPGMMLWILFPLVFIAAFQIVLLYLFGNSIISVDMFLNVVTTNFNEATELLGNITPIVAAVFILYLPALILGVLSIMSKDMLTSSFVSITRRNAIIGMIVGIVLTIACRFAYSDYRVHLNMFPVNACYNLGLAVERSYDLSHYEETSKDFSYNARSTHDAEQPEVYVMVVGETGRACNWGLYGYKRNTTPLLNKQKGIAAFRDVLTQSNTTHKSVPMLMSLASAENYDRIYHEKGIITAFREAGFYTAFLSNQRFNHSFIDKFGYEADSVVFLKEGAKEDHNINDNMLINKLDELLSAGHNKLFVVLHTYGSHFNYKERYPKEDAVYLPDEVINLSYENRQNLVNAYDNTIVQTDKFLYNIIKRIDKHGRLAAMLYTSDHGEDIFDDNRKRFLHSSPVPTYYQMHVPFIVWTSDTFATQYPNIVENLSDNVDMPVASNASAIHTMLQISGISSPLRNDTLSVASNVYNVTKRYFINDHNKPVSYDKIGLDKEDFDLFKINKIHY